MAGQTVTLTVLDFTGRVVYQASEAVFTGQTALDLSELLTGCSNTGSKRYYHYLALS